MPISLQREVVRAARARPSEAHERPDPLQVDQQRRATSVASRQYRLAQGVVAIGALALGALVVDLLVDRWHESIFLYYGLEPGGYQALQQLDAGLPVSFGQFAVAVIASIGMLGFIASELWRARVHRNLEDECACACPRQGARSIIVAERLTLGEWYRQMVGRTSLAGGGLFAAWTLQMAFERWAGGHGWGLVYADVRSALPLVSIFGVCVLAGVIVALITIVGMRAVRVLQVLVEQVIRRLRAPRATRLRRGSYHPVLALRELLGVDILSRPPPVTA